jgi:CRP-like cAMP-binding protein
LNILNQPIFKLDKNFSFLNSFSDISEDVFSKLQEVSNFIEVDSKTQLVKPGEIPNKIYLLISGIMRVYLSSEDGKEYNNKFFLSMSFVAPLTALVTNSKSILTYEALTPCQLYEINFDVFIDLVNTNLSVSSLYIKGLEHVYMEYEKRQLDFISMNATQRYLALKEDIPEIDTLISQYQIASYLSITPVQLSRIRKKIKTAN